MAKRKSKKNTAQDTAAPTQTEGATTEGEALPETISPELVEAQLNIASTEDVVVLTEEAVAEKPKTLKQKKFQSEDVERELLSIEAATGTMIKGFKESWLPAIRVKARSMGIDGDATKSAWRAVFVAWGGYSILK